MNAPVLTLSDPNWMLTWRVFLLENTSVCVNSKKLFENVRGMLRNVKSVGSLSIIRDVFTEDIAQVSSIICRVRNTDYRLSISYTLSPLRPVSEQGKWRDDCSYFELKLSVNMSVAQKMKSREPPEQLLKFFCTSDFLKLYFVIGKRWSISEHPWPIWWKLFPFKNSSIIRSTDLSKIPVKSQLFFENKSHFRTISTRNRLKR